jgi:hypothetical protein
MRATSIGNGCAVAHRPVNRCWAARISNPWRTSATAIVRSTPLLSFTRDAVLPLGIITLLPVAPLVLTMIPLKELLTQLLQILL